MTPGQRKGLKWLLGSLGGLLLAALIAAGVAAHWLRESWASGRIGARGMLLLSWDKELVSEDPQRGLMTLRERDGGRTFIVSYRDYERGLIIERDEWGTPQVPLPPSALPAGGP